MESFKTYVINLEHRTDRWDHVKDEVKRITDDTVVRFNAIRVKPGWVGCKESHLAILAMNHGGKPFLVLEDDVLFFAGAKENLQYAIKQLPEDWDMLYLGASPKEPQERYSPFLYRLKNAHVTHAILWNPRSNGAMEYTLKNRHKIRKIDDFFATEVQPQFNCFVVYPIKAVQMQTQSDIAQRSDVSTILTNYLRYCK